MKIIATAEAFGYGPASKLHAICSAVAREHAASHVVGNDTALTFARSNAGTYASVRSVHDMTELAAISPDSFDVAVSVMDPFLVTWAAYQGVPCVYVDSLYWFWDWAGITADDLRAATLAVTGASSVAGALEATARLPMHLSQYVANHLCSVACVQRTDAASAPARRVPDHPDVRIVDAIVDLSHRRPEPADIWLATTSGMLNPLVSVDLAATWLRTVGALLGAAAELGGCTEPMVLAGNPEVLERAAPDLPDRLEPVPLGHAGLLEHLNRAVACLAPPGLTTTLECAAYGTPVIFLPEQHYGHLANYRLLTSDGGEPGYPEALLSTRARRSVEQDMSVETASLIRQLDAHRAQRSDVWSDLVRSVADGMRRAREDRSRMAAAQDDLVRGMVDGYTGAAQVCDAVHSVLRPIGAAS
jgi:hypothetical protein